MTYVAPTPVPPTRDAPGCPCQGASQGSTAGGGEAGSCPAPGAEERGGIQDSAVLGCSLSKRRGPRRAWPPASAEEARARPQIRSRIFPFNDLLYGLVFFGGFFSPAFWEWGGGKRLYCSWLGWGAAGVHQMPVGIEVVPGTGREGGYTAAAFVCVSEGRAAPGARGQGHGEGGCHRAGGGSIPFPAGWEVGQEVCRVALISAAPPTPKLGGWWDGAMEAGGGGTQLCRRSRGTHPAASRRHLCPARPQEEMHICKRGGGREGVGEPPKKLKKEKKKKKIKSRPL